MTAATVALASLYIRLGRFSQAEPLLLRSLKLSEAKFGPDHPALAVCTNNLAILYKLIRQDAKAEAYFLRTVKLKEVELGPNHPSVALSVNNLAVLYNDTGRHAQAEPLFQRCLKIQEATMGPGHPDVALALNNLANLYDNLQRPAEAEVLYGRSLKIREAALGPDHPDVSESLNNLARLYLTGGRLSKAEPLFVRSLKILEAALGPEHPETASHGLNNLANLEIARRQPAAAAELYDRARRIVRRHVAHTLPMLSEEEQLTFLRETDRCWSSQERRRGGRAAAGVSVGRGKVGRQYAVADPRSAVGRADERLLHEPRRGQVAGGRASRRTTLHDPLPPREV